MAIYHLAQVNIGRVRAPVEDPLMSGFVSRLDEINALADRSPGFIWRLQTPVGNATYFRPYPEDDRILINMSVWESIASLRHYVYKTAHAELLRQREEWFERFSGIYYIWPCGGFQRDTGPESMKRPSGWPIWKSTGRRSSHSLLRRPSNRTSTSNKASTGPPSCLVRLQADRMRAERIDPAR